MDLRQNIYALSDSALAGVIGAINALKADGGYDDFVRRHFLAGHAMHRGPAFLPWHRFLIREFEQALQLRGRRTETGRNSSVTRKTHRSRRAARQPLHA